jgi:hypothetical protein
MKAMICALALVLAAATAPVAYFSPVVAQPCNQDDPECGFEVPRPSKKHPKKPAPKKPAPKKPAPKKQEK